MSVITCLLAALPLFTNVAATVEAVRRGNAGARFALSVRVISLLDRTGNDPRLAVEDSTGRMLVSYRLTRHTPADFASGQSLQVNGLVTGSTLKTYFFATAERIVLGERGAPVAPIPVTPRTFQSGDVDNRLVSLRGIVRDAFKDEIDARNYFLVLDCAGESVYATFLSAHDRSGTCQALLNAEIALSGICRETQNSYRRFQGRLLSVPDIEAVSILRKGDARFDAPEIRPSELSSPEAICRMGERTCSGQVLAAWQGSRLLLRTHDGDCVGVALFCPASLPRPGTWVEVVGTPATDLYHISLTHAQGREIRADAVPEEPPADLSSAADILRDDDGSPRINPRFHGRRIRLRGTVVALPNPENGNGILRLDDDGILVPVDVSENPAVLGRLGLGDRLSVDGICVIDTENWTPLSHFPRTKGFFLVVRTPQDVTLLARPSWWTPQRLLSILGLLALALFVFLGWNRMLNRLVARKSRQLLKDETALADADFRMNERTRLAVELHDSISQALTGVAGLLSAALKRLGDARAHDLSPLIAAERMLASCRTSLRHCLYDLRSDASDDPDLASAIRKTLSPECADVTLELRIDVPRHRVPDSTVHAILCILRELVGNARNHGGATRIRVVGERDGDRLAFSVTDNGSGFDPQRVPGLAQGHFGLDGIRSRIRRLNGTFTLDAAPGKGTRAVVTFPLQKDAHA